MGYVCIAVSKMNIFLSLLFGVLTALCIMSFALPYYKRQKFFVAFNQFLDNISLNTSFFQNDLHTIINQTSKYSGTFEQVIKAYNHYLSTNDQSILNNEIQQITSIDTNDKMQLTQFLVSLGKSDCETQASNTKLAMQYVKDRLEQTRQEISNKAVLIQKLGIIAGLVVFVLLL